MKKNNSMLFETKVALNNIYVTIRSIIIFAFVDKCSVWTIKFAFEARAEPKKHSLHLANEYFWFKHNDESGLYRQTLMKILIICTGNSCRSQMAHGFLKSFDPDLEVFSSGIKPESVVNPFAIRVMNESFIDISHHSPHHVNEYLNNDFDLLLTVCDTAQAKCPVFEGNIKNRMHRGFEDPANATGSDLEIMEVYRQIRDEIKNEMFIFYKHFPKKQRSEN